MEYIQTIDDLTKRYGEPGAASLRKVVHQMTPLYRKWVMASRFCVLTTVGADGTDASPRGDDGPVVQELDAHTLLMPDWRGNNRLDSLRNIVSDGRVSLMFMVPGSNTIVRVNGQARLSVDAEIIGRFKRKSTLPTCVIVVKIGEIYTQCARAPLRAGLWTRDDAKGLPTAGEILAEASGGDEGGADYDAAWAARAAKSMW